MRPVDARTFCRKSPTDAAKPTLVQAFVIPTGSMEDTLLVGDHVLVDKLASAPAGSVARNLLPYENTRRGDIIVFRWPGDIRRTYVKRVVGVAGDRRRSLQSGAQRSAPDRDGDPLPDQNSLEPHLSIDPAISCSLS